MLFIGASVVPIGNANHDLGGDRQHSPLWSGPIEPDTLLQRINTLNDGKLDFQLFMVSLDWTDDYHHLSNSTIPDSDGYYAFSTAPGTCNITAGGMSMQGNGTLSTWNSTGQFLIDELSGIVWKNLTLMYPNPTATIIGHIYDNKSNPLNHALVGVVYFNQQGMFDGWNSTFTNDTGYYKLQLPPSNVLMLAAQADGYQSAGEPSFLIGNETQIHDFHLKPLPPPPPPPAQSIKGYVLDNMTHQPIAYASVSVVDPTIFYYNATSTNDTGYYEFKVPIGNYTITTMQFDYYTNTTTVQIKENDEKWVNINLQPFIFPNDNAWVEGHVYQNGLGPLKNAQVTIYGSFSTNFTFFDFTRSAVSDQNGYYNVSVPAVPNDYPMSYSEIFSIDATASGYFDNSTRYYYPLSIIEPGDVFIGDIYLDPHPIESCTIQGYITLIGWNVTPPVNAPPSIQNENPTNGSTSVSRPPSELSISVEDPDGDPVNVYIRLKNHTGTWVTLESYLMVGNGIYVYTPPYENDWIWGNTTYTWSVNVTDGITWTNQTYVFTTKGSRYDVNNNDKVNFQDAGLVWTHRTSAVPYDGLYDVNQDGKVNFQDAGLTWVHRD
jgi:hypothetical protein